MWLQLECITRCLTTNIDVNYCYYNIIINIIVIKYIFKIPHAK